MRQLQHFRASRYGSLLCLRSIERRLVESEHVGQWESELRGLVRSLQPSVLLIDLSCLDRCSKEAINSLIQIKRQIATFGGSLELCALSPRVAETFRVMKLEGPVFTVHASLEHALHAVPAATLQSV